jgi:hypothetical protein
MAVSGPPAGHRPAPLALATRDPGGRVKRNVGNCRRRRPRRAGILRYGHAPTEVGYELIRRGNAVPVALPIGEAMMGLGAEHSIPSAQF